MRPILLFIATCFLYQKFLTLTASSSRTRAVSVERCAVRFWRGDVLEIIEGDYKGRLCLVIDPTYRNDCNQARCLRVMLAGGVHFLISPKHVRPYGVHFYRS